MSNLSEIKTQLDLLVASASGFEQLTHILNIEKNRFTEGGRFGIIPRGGREVKGQTQAITQDLIFSVVLTNTYISNSISDQALIDKVIVLMGLFDDIYKSIANSKCNKPDIVLMVSTFDVSEAIIIESEKTIIVEGNLTVRVRNTL
jgi:hypothetical protein